MKKTISLCKNYEFHRAYKKGSFKAGRYIVVYALENRKGLSRLGISVGKKAGNSVQRSRITRLIRESYRLTEDNLKDGYDIVIAARPAKRGAEKPNRKVKALSVPEFADISSELQRLMDKLSLFKEQGNEE